MSKNFTLFTRILNLGLKVRRELRASRNEERAERREERAEIKFEERKKPTKTYFGREITDEKNG